MKNLFAFFSLLSFIQAFSQSLNDSVIGTTFYDLQTNRSVQNRIITFPDGTLGTTWNWGDDLPTFIDLGTGYAFYNGIKWSLPEKVFNAKNPSYTFLGENGEIIVGEGSNDLKLAIRNNKGTGQWIISNLDPPAGTNKLYSPLVFTSGANHQTIHILCMKKISWSGVNPPNAGQVLYSRSTDMGNSWDILHHEFTMLGVDHYYGFSEQAITVAEPEGDHLAFAVGDYLTDMVLMKSDDNGDNWSETVIWHHPYDFFLVGPGNINFFHCQDGSCTVALDDQGVAHVVFGVSEIRVENGMLTHFNAMGALGYWREGMPAFAGTEHRLHPDSLAASGNLIKQYTHDFFIKPAYNSLGMATMPSMAIEGENITVAYSLLGGPLSFETNNEIFTVQSTDGGNSWENESLLTSDLIHVFDECIFPSISSNNYMNKWAVVCQCDAQPGLAVNGDHFFDVNNINVLLFDMDCFPEDIYVDFIADTTTIHEGDTVFFTNLTQSCPSPQWFEWSFEGGTPETSGLVNPEIQYNLEGTYFVSLHSTNGIINDNEVKQNYIHVLPATGLNEIKNKKPFVIHRDNLSNFSIKMTDINFREIKIKVLDIKGREIISSDHFLNRLNLNDQPAGIYLLSILIDDEVYTDKIVMH